MFLNLKRLLAVGTATAVALVGFAPAPTAQASASSRAVTRAAVWLKAHPATVDDGISGEIASATGLALARKHAPTLRKRVTALEAKATTAVDGKPGAAASLIILVTAMHLDPTNFGNTDLVQKLLDGIDSTGQVGSFGSAYGQALAIIALERADEPVPPAVVDKLLTFQASSGASTGAFGYEFNGFNADPDSTALAMQALHLIRGHGKEIRTAIAWAKSTQTRKGYWASFSPVDSTSLMASALKLVGRSSGKASSWLRTQQLKNGGFAAELKQKSSTANLLATSTAMFLLSGRSLATFSYKLKGYTASPRPKLSGTAAVGSTLTAKVGTWSPSPTLTIQWQRSGTPIAGATSATYTLTGADLGKKIRVRVTARGIGLKTATEFSKYTKSVRP